MELKEVFEPVLNFIKNLQKKDKEIASKQAAKDRLKLVLMQDRASVSPDFFELMKQEIIDVIKKYIEIDEESLEVELTRGLEAGLEGPALYANIPIKNVKPVAPKNEDDEESEVMTEEEAEVMAEQILNQIEEKVEVVPINEKEENNIGDTLQGDAQNKKEEKNVGALVQGDLPKEKIIENQNDSDKKQKIEDNKKSEKEEKVEASLKDNEEKEVKKTTRKTSTTKKKSTTTGAKKTTTKKTTSTKTKK